MDTQRLELLHSWPARTLFAAIAEHVGFDLTLMTPLIRCTQCGRYLQSEEEVDQVQEHNGEQKRLVCHPCYMHSLTRYLGRLMNNMWPTDPKADAWPW